MQKPIIDDQYNRGEDCNRQHNMEPLTFLLKNKNNTWTPDEFIMPNAGPRGGTKRNKVKCKAQRKARKQNRK